MGEAWTNWTGDQRCVPAVVERPGSRAEVVAAVERAAEAGRTVRVAGSGHSFSDLVPTGGTLLRLDRMRGMLEVDRSSGLVRVEGGITIAELTGRLAAHGLAFENLGDIDAQTLAGAISTATHGTGGRLPNLSAQVEALELVLADGSTARIGADQPTLRCAARVGLGALGVITAATLRAIPAFTLRGVDEPRPLEDVLDRLDEHVEGNDHFELFVFPWARDALTRTNNRVDEAPHPPSTRRAWVEDVAVNNGALELICRLGRAQPALIPYLNRLVTRLAGTRERVDRSDRVFASPRMVRFTEMEYALPRAAAAEAVRAVRALVAQRRFAVNFPIELRFSSGDDAFLSPAHGRDSAYVAVHVFKGMEWEPYFRAVEEIMGGLGGRPHWGKRTLLGAEELRGRYPAWDRFQAVRARLDPEGRFANAGIERLLGPAAPAQRNVAPSPR